ncbi:MAG TPA: ribosome maturation factor RimP [Actinomycetes bacterium]|nr:ribosome maturation factor RimP [Actinomycetes bacterium]
MSAVADRVEQALSPVIAERGFDLEGVEVQPAGRRRLVRVLVDQDGGVTLDDIASLTAVLSAHLDETDAMGEQPYVLEVSSPGVGRPLTLTRHWRRNRDRKVALKTTLGQSLSGRIIDSDDSGVTLAELVEEGVPAEAISETRTLQYADIAEAHVEVEF